MLVETPAILLWVFTIPFALASQDKMLKPQGFPPSTGFAKADTQNGCVMLEVTAFTIIPVTETREVVRNGRKVKETKRCFKPLTITGLFLVAPPELKKNEKRDKTVERRLPTNRLKVFRKNGKLVAQQEVPNLFKGERAVLIFGSKKPDPYYLQFGHDEVLVITNGQNLVFPRTEEY
ncbi:MAG: hypothetical protein ACFCD0_09825 [Gemmataceae bacterium]